MGHLHGILEHIMGSESSWNGRITPEIEVECIRLLTVYARGAIPGKTLQKAYEDNDLDLVVCDELIRDVLRTHGIEEVA